MRSIRKHEMIIYDNNHNCSSVELLLAGRDTCCCSVAGCSFVRAESVSEVGGRREVQEGKGEK